MNISCQSDYDLFLINNKLNTIKRVDDYINLSTGIKHMCLDTECGRIWKPSPKQMLDDDYYCPSCVLHHRNNMDRFLIDRLKWTKNIPNTFYVYDIVDPKFPDIKLVKFGRTQHKNSTKRYPKKEIVAYKMKNIFELRNRLIITTKIENYWKLKATELNIFHTFSDESFHGKTECIIINDDILKNLFDMTNTIIDNNNDDPKSIL